MPRMRCEMEAGSRTGGRESASARGSSPIYRRDGTEPIISSKSYEYIRDTSMKEKLAHVLCKVYPTYGDEADAVIELLRVNKWLKKGVLKIYKSNINL
uniref:Uncharacterized protein n=1 Tax=viral metagenome TaxID=1070528 RepID=A0A6M3KYD6_9ZZZZ